MKHHVFLSIRIIFVLFVMLLCINVKAQKKKIVAAQLQALSAEVNQQKAMITGKPILSEKEIAKEKEIAGIKVQRNVLDSLKKEKEIRTQLRTQLEKSKDSSLLKQNQKEMEKITKKINSLTYDIMGKLKLPVTAMPGSGLEEVVVSWNNTDEPRSNSKRIEVDLDPVPAIKAADSVIAKSKTDSTANAEEGDKPSTEDPKVKAALSSLEAMRKNLDETIKTLNQKSIVSFGVSIGPRIGGKNYRDNHFAYLDPADSTLRLDKRDHSAFVISTGISISPFIQQEEMVENAKGFGKFGAWLLKNIGIHCNINLLEINSSESLSFNKSIDGGIGLSLHLGGNIYIAATREFYSTRELKEHFLTMEGKPLYKDGNKVSELAESDDRFFKSRLNQGWAYRIIIGF